jgi:hypothetical protein
VLVDSYYLPDPQLVLAQIAGEEGEYDPAIAFSNLALEQYEARQDVVLTASVRLFQAELAYKMGEYDSAAVQFTRAYTLRQTVKRPFTPREQTRYDAFLQTLSGTG